MTKPLAQIVEESIKLEQYMADLYKFFSDLFPQDSGFWKKLSSEEENHAALIRTGKVVLLSCDEFPNKILAPTLEELIATNNRVSLMLTELRNTPPSRRKAFNLAISFEESAGELHFQKAMKEYPESEYVKIFQELNRDDRDHARRIREHRDSSGI